MFCDKTKEFLSQNNISFTEKNVAADPSALEELRKLGYMTTPVTVIDDAVIVGFDTAKLQSALSAG
jgi:glutaredoxin